MSKFLTDMMKGFQSNDPRYINLSNHSGKEESRILSQLPYEEFGDLSQVRFVSASYNEIRHLSPRIGELIALEGLDLSENPLESIPNTIGNLTKLKFFKANNTAELNYDSYFSLEMKYPGHYPEYTSDAGLTGLPESFAKLKQLRSLYLESNRLDHIPAGIYELENLEFLDLGWNAITHIPDEIGQLSNLKYLKLSRNNFSDLPDSIGNLTKLTRLRLDGLFLDSLPEGIGGLENLEMLEICSGRVENIPATVKHLAKLTHLYLIDTEISETDLNVFKILLPQTQIVLKNIFEE